MFLTSEDYARKAAELWAAFTRSERHGVSFGLFPAVKMTAAELAGYATHPLVVALMKHARRNQKEGGEVV